MENQTQEQQDHKPPQFFNIVLTDNEASNSAKVIQCQVLFNCSMNESVSGLLLLFEDYIVAKIKDTSYMVEMDLTLNFVARQTQLQLEFYDCQRELTFIVKFLEAKQFSFFLQTISKSLFQTDFSQKYEILKKLGKGKTSDVFQIQRKSDKQILAAKFYNYVPSTITNQVTILRALEHPNLIYFRSVFLENGSVYIVMDYQDGGTLLDKINQAAFMSTRQKIKFLTDMLNAFEFLRIKNIVHRDIKPQNILYSEKDKNYKIADFQLAEFQNQEISKLTGTPGYLAPELFQQDQHIYSNKKSDIYSLGLVYYELQFFINDRATKKQYFRGDTKQAILKANKQAKSLKRKTINKDQLCGRQYGILRMMIRNDPDRRKLSIQILQSSEMRKMIKQYSLDVNSTLSSSASSPKKKKATKDTDQWEEGIQQEKFLGNLKRLLKIKSVVV